MSFEERSLEREEVGVGAEDVLKTGSAVQYVIWITACGNACASWHGNDDTAHRAATQN